MGGVSASSDVFRAVADPTRRALLDMLRDARDRSASELARPFRMSRPAIAQHMRILRHAGLVRCRRAGRLQLYRLNAKPIHEVYAWAARYVTDPSGHVWGIRQS
jgi:DNA-binding transcriptional ArsR family regulator